MYIRTINVSGCTDRLSRYTPLYSKSKMPAIEKPALYLNPLNNHPITEAPAGDHQGPEPFQTTELPGASPRPKKHPPIDGRIIT